MSTSKLTIPQLITLTCDSITDVLDLYRHRNPNALPAEIPSTVDRLKDLHGSLERLETAAEDLDNDGATLDEDRKRNIDATLNDCGSLAKTIRLQIERGSLLRYNSNTSRDIEGLIRAVELASEGIIAYAEDESNEDFTEYHESITGDDDDDVSSTPMPQGLLNTSQLVKRLQRENELLKGKYLDLQESDRKKLDHIRQLHEAIRGLNKFCPPQYEQETWDTLSEELPRLLVELRETHQTLERLGSRLPTPISPTSLNSPLSPKLPSKLHRTRSETNPLPSSSTSTIDANFPKQSDSHESSQSATQLPSSSRSTYRSPSPTQSNVSSTMSKTKKKPNAGSKRISTGSPGFPIRFNR